MNPITIFLTLVCGFVGLGLLLAGLPPAAAAFFVLAILIAASLKMANMWERFVILRAGRLQGVKGPGLFFIVPVLDSITAILKAERLTLRNVVKTTVFLADMNDFAEMNEIYGRYFSDNKPARATVQAARLPRDAKVEIDCIAIV